MRRKDKKIEQMTEDADNMAVAEEMARSIHKMIVDRDDKAASAKSHLVSQLKITVDKYRTANGVMSALQTVRDVVGLGQLPLDDELMIAKGMATKMANATMSMAAQAENLLPEEMDQLCNGFYDKEFSDGDIDSSVLIYELMRIQLCQNVGPNAEDIVDFHKRATEEIEKTREDLRKLCEDNGLDYLGIMAKTE